MLSNFFIIAVLRSNSVFYSRDYIDIFCIRLMRFDITIFCHAKRNVKRKCTCSDNKKTKNNACDYV